MALATHEYCGSVLPSEYYSSGNTLFIDFRSDSTIEKSGFALIAKLLTGKLFFHKFTKFCK